MNKKFILVSEIIKKKSKKKNPINNNIKKHAKNVMKTSIIGISYL